MAARSARVYVPLTQTAPAVAPAPGGRIPPLCILIFGRLPQANTFRLWEVLQLSRDLWQGSIVPQPGENRAGKVMGRSQLGPGTVAATAPGSARPAPSPPQQGCDPFSPRSQGVPSQGAGPNDPQCPGKINGDV